MKLKNKHVYYIIGLVLAFITFIPPVPKALQYLLALIPILFFGADLTVECMKEIFDKKYINRYLTAIIVGLGLIITGRITYAAITMIFFSAADYYFDKTLTKARRRIDDSSNITAPYARAVVDGKGARISVGTIVPGNTLILKEGDIIPCDCAVTNGEAQLDYTNIFGKGDLRVAKAGSPCFAGGIVQSGSLMVVAQKSAKDSLAALITYRTKKAHAPSPLHKRINMIARIFEPAVYLLALIMFIILMIATKDLPLAVNLTSVILVASPAFGMTTALSMLNHNALLSARKRGVVFTNMAAVEQCGKVQTVSVNEQVSEEVLRKIDETGAIPAKGGHTELDAVLYRDRARLEADPNPSFKLALGFFSGKAGAAALDAQPVRIAGAIRTAHNYRNVFLQNALCILIEKLVLISLAFLLNITPAAAVVIEFAAWMICLFNSTRENM